NIIVLCNYSQEINEKERKKIGVSRTYHQAQQNLDTSLKRRKDSGMRRRTKGIGGSCPHS
ncbi:unnamed protein product, partial [Callosobruchus maculatus]